MADPKALPPAASAEGESAALQAQIVDASTLEKRSISRDHRSSDEAIPMPQKKTEAGMVNYLVGAILMLCSRLTWQSASSSMEPH